MTNSAISVFGVLAINSGMCESLFYVIFLSPSLTEIKWFMSDLVQMGLLPGKAFIVGSSQKLLHHRKSIYKEAIKASLHSY